MCIAILSEHGVGYPTEEVFKRCWNKNPHGAGYAYLTTNDTWRVKKGLMTFDAFWKSYQAEKFENEHLVIIHFRWGTSGKRENGKPFSGCTHPFPITNDNDYLMCEDFEDENIVLHNGVVSGGTAYLSDTQETIKYYITPLLPYLKDNGLEHVIHKCLESEGYKGSRWFIARGKEYTLYGPWLKEDNIWYSKADYKPEPVKQPITHKSTNIQTAFQKIIAPGYKAIEFLTNNKWNWKLWDKFDNENNKDLIKQNKDQFTEIFDMEGNIIGLVDSSGEVVWDEEDTKVTVDNSTISSFDADDTVKCGHCGIVLSGDELLTSGKCPTCGGDCHIVEIICPHCSGEMSWDDLNGNNCPFCFQYIDLNDLVTLAEIEDDIECPYCQETDSLIYTEHKVECLKCGCIFKKNQKGWEGVIDWNQKFLDKDRTQDANN